MAVANLDLVEARKVRREVTPALPATDTTPAVPATIEVIYQYKFVAIGGATLGLVNTELNFETRDPLTAKLYPLGQDYAVEVKPAVAATPGFAGFSLDDVAPAQ